MLLCFYLLLHITEGCWLEGNEGLIRITAYTGDSVLLPCSCTDLQTTPETFTWERYTTYAYKWVKISPESEQYKERFQLVNDRSSGNLSLLISHLTEEDGGDYRCSVKGSQYRDIKLTVKGCTLNQPTETVTGYVGQSVLLPCSCSELQAKPQAFTWRFSKESGYKEIFPKDQTNLYTDRVQLFNDHLPGNLSLLVSHLTVEDGGDYRCRIRYRIYRDIRLTVRDAPVTRTTSPHSKPDPQHIYISVGVVMALLLLLIFGGVMYWKHIEQRRRQTEISDGQTGQQTQQKKKNFTEPMNLITTSEPTYESVHTQNDSVVPYTAINPQSQRNNVEEKDDVTYLTVVHGNTVRAAHTQQASGDTTVYASIKTN
ncbi:uncharacterized protein LOC132872165 [Neoarius graeffei]|uniref:uncharacterized protein LOC132872165 n=1 Tax=Neoarius graeffei TaxID=443677 RepID=UPI00298CB467|nr:uncharacterized protein LOC132872165 [Neoarius graeffei]